MRLVTRRGEFDSLQTLRGAYLRSGRDMRLDPGHAGGHDWEDDKLHPSEVGRCLRSQMLRILGAPKKVKSEKTIANEQVMYWIGYRLHYLTYEALDWAGILVAHEKQVFHGDWAGRCDAIFTPDYRDPDQRWLLDVKSYRPKAARYAHLFPKQMDVLQVTAYAGAMDGLAEAMIEYIPQGGSTPPIECFVDLHDSAYEANVRMAQMENALHDVRERGTAALPDPLEASFTAHYRKKRGEPFKELSSVTWDASWQCSYCDYCHTQPPRDDREQHPPLLETSPCKPPWHDPVDVAKRSRGKWSFASSDGSWDPDALDRFFESQVKTLPLVGGQDEEA